MFSSKFGLITLLLALSVPALAGPASVKGQVLQTDGNALSGAVISAQPSNRKAVSDSRGYFILAGLSGGETYTLRIEYLGHEPVTREITVEDGLNFFETVRLQAMPEESLELVVIGSLRDSQVKALNEQHLASNIKNIIAADQIGSFPDSNAAEAIQRAPGVNIARDQGEGRYVQVRGTEARLNKTVMDGFTLPAPEGDLRTVALDAIPLNLLEAIEITKANVPDMDGDAVGGAINLVTKNAPQKEMLSARVDMGYNELAEDNLVFGNVTWGRRFNGDKLGVLASFSLEDTKRGSDNFEASYDDGVPEELEQRDYDVERDRLGAHLALDFRPNGNAHYTFKGSYAQFDDQEFRRRVTHNIEDGEIERELKDRYETQSILNFRFNGEIFTNSGGTWDFSAAYGYARESEPGRLDTNFVQEDVTFAPNWEAGSRQPFNWQPNPLNENIANFEFDDITREDNITTDEHLTAKLSYAWPVSFGSNGVAYLKTGLKLRTKEKMRNNEVFKYEADDITLPGYTDTGYNNASILGRYDMGAMPGRDGALRLLEISESEKDFEEDSGDYQVEEDLTAAYFMATIDFNEKLTFLPGVRYERIQADYTGYEVIFDEEGDFLETLPQKGDNTDDIIMPHLHMKYKLTDGSQVRAALTRGYARARVYDQVPYRLLLREDSEIEEGNPEIEITKVWNADLMFEHYFGEAGLFSAGIFYKDMTDPIFIYNFDEVRGGQEWEVTRPLNGTDATLVGGELVFQTNFYKGFGMYFNMTFTNSEATILDRVDEKLPGQADEMGNLALIYERGRFSGRISGNLHGEYLEEVSDDPAEDIFVDEHFQIDLNAAYRMERFKISLEINNLSDEPLVRYEGTKAQPIQLEEYGMWGRLGVTVDF